MKTHEYFCNRFRHLEMINQEKRFWESLKEELVSRVRLKSMVCELQSHEVFEINDALDTLTEEYGHSIRRVIRQIMIKLTVIKLCSIKEITDGWTTHVLRKYKQNNDMAVISVSVQAIERSDEGLSIRNIIGDPPIPFIPELVTYKKAYCVITRLRCPDGVVIYDKEIIDEICLEG